MTDIATIPKNSREEIRVSLENFKGHDIVNLRVWFQAGDDMRPTKKGLAFSPALLSQVIDALQTAHVADGEGS